MLIPISLYVSVEFVKAFIAHIISSDRLMYVEEDDMPSKARSAGLCEELGQVRGGATARRRAAPRCVMVAAASRRWVV